MKEAETGDRLERIRGAIRERFDAGFDWVAPGPVPWAAPPTCLEGLRVALVTTGGLRPRRDPPFDIPGHPLGDTSHRLISHGAGSRELALGDDAVDPRYAARDPEVALPMRALERLHREGKVGRPAPRHASFCSGIVRPLPGLAESAARLASLFQQEGAGAMVLLPTCSLCVQSVCILAREFEGRGLPTVTLTMLPELTRIVGAPRSLSVRFPFGAPCGDPGNPALHRAVLLEALELLVSARAPGEIAASGYSWRRDPRSCSS